MTRQIILYDTTLRDGTQGEQVNLSAEDKLRLCRKLDGFGIHYVEGGWRRAFFIPSGLRPTFACSMVFK